MIRIMMFCLMLFGSEAGAELYKFRNAEGDLVIAQSIPPELAKNGYTIMSDNGEIIQVVPAALTEEELAAAAINGEALRLMEEEKIRQAKADEVLKRLYKSPGDVIYARDIKIKQLDKQIERVQERQQKNVERRQQLMATAAAQERSGQSVDELILQQIAATENRIEHAREEMEILAKEKTDLVISYNKDYERIRLLYGLDKISSPQGGEQSVSGGTH